MGELYIRKAGYAGESDVPSANAELVPFDPWSTCPMCGHDDLWTRYEPGHTECSFSTCDGEAERLDRGCRRCGVQWSEATA